ncbi:MAG TPA: EAL domain-containing protein, partial [Rhodocyclaceae bacterium]|nr:EAL domain-containing protein [Rhodocyclaceae bacterium]
MRTISPDQAVPRPDRLQDIMVQIQQATGADLVLVGDVFSAPVPRIQTLGCRIDDRWIDSFSYLQSTHPCGQVVESGAFRHWPDIAPAFPEAYLWQDHALCAYAGMPLALSWQKSDLVLALGRRTPWNDPAALPAQLAPYIAMLSECEESACHAITLARLARRLFLRDESFREFVFDNPSGYAFTELMPPVPVNLPEEKLIERLLTTAIVAECNPAMARMYGYADPSQMVGINTVQAYGTEKATRNITYWVRQNYDIRNAESQSVDAEGHISWISGSVFGNVVDGRLLHFWTKRRDLTEQKRYEAAIQHKAHHDTLTGLPNRLWFQERVDTLIPDHIARNKRLCVGLLDLNGFKEINDTLGHGIGDAMLRALAIRLLKGLKPHGAEMARLGGDEFAIIMPEIQSPQSAEDMAHTVQQLLNQVFEIDDMQLTIGASLGLVMFPDWQGMSEELLRLADVAMYSAKNEGAAFRWYQKEIDKHSKRRLSLLSSLGKAIEQSELFLVYQPKINLRDGQLTGFEALLRWRHPTHGLIPPDDFIPFAETNEVIRPLTSWVLHAAIRQGALWLEHGLNAQMAVNVSVRNLLDDQLEHEIAELLQRYGFPAELLELEVTESALMTRPAQAMHVLQQLRGQGISVAIDDFGTGYSSLAYLAKLPVTTLKVDRSFVFDMMRSSSEELIVRSIVGLAHQCRLHVVAEGVEDASTLAALLDMGCDQAQGYHI